MTDPLEFITNPTNKLPESFYQKDLLLTAKNLLGKIFVRKHHNDFYAGKIVEVEAYDGNMDQAAHTYNGITERNKVMFEKGGKLYVYFTYGKHYCANVVVGKAGVGKAVLLRAVEPLLGMDKMFINRYGSKTGSFKNLTNGPAKFAQAFKIDKKENGSNLADNNIFLVKQKKLNDDQIISTTRIGITRSKELPWRFYIKDNDFVSKK